MTTKNKQLTALNELGQSLWIDNLSKVMLDSGELKDMVDAGITGLTSNPTIFKQAIADTTNYDSDLITLAKKKLSADEICEELMIADVGKAADLLLSVYKASSGRDGYASIEVNPNLAENTAATVEAARRIWKKLSRPNVMVKIPATPAGIPAIQQALEDGININVTLIFSTGVYEKVANAYVTALEKRLQKGQPIANISSVASFFVSRVDAIHEKKFDELVGAKKVDASEKNSILAKIGIANSKLAFESFSKIFGDARFKKLAAAGARVQRPLWASTGTKNPAFAATLYVEELAGRDTVNTLPPATLKALMNFTGTFTAKLHQDLAGAKNTIAHAQKLGLPFESLLEDLQTQGVKSFSDSYRDLENSIETKRQKAVA